MTVWTVVDSWPLQESVPLLLALALMTVTCLRPRVRITDNELLIRYPIGSRRIPRSHVHSAEFKSSGLTIYLRDGNRALAFVMPKLTSTELSGDPPPIDSAAYQITQWANGRPF
jgi:hypothetical protein